MTASRSPQSTAEPTHYQQLGVSPWASTESIRRAYRELSKRYHPDTSMLAPELAKRRFQRLQQAYAVLSNPAQRATYDASIGCGKIPVLHLNQQVSGDRASAEANLASYDLASRPLSSAEISALVAFGVTVVVSLAIVGVVSLVSV
ncbi:MAG: J domain-containing protein [Cyanobacteria bacterium J06639_1]